ncbi:MAG TPA: 2'-5' RNA ligase family protein [Gaiellaceae bacterium]|nr:2'-5' RNA ligase family protein [Gaiellaceae bacterium]
MSRLRTALIVPVPEAAPAVDPWRERTCADRPSAGVPAHVTVLFPFVPATEIDDRLIDDLRALFAEHRSFSFELREPRRFPGVLYLAPEPAEPFLELVHAAALRFPELPPYGGEIPLASIVPHLTVAHGEPALLDEAEAEMRPLLPIRTAADEVVLLEELEPDWGRWEPRAALPLGSTPV